MTDGRAARLDQVIEDALRQRSGHGRAPADLLPAVAAQIRLTPQRRGRGGGQMGGPSGLLLVAAVVAVAGAIGIGVVGGVRPGPRNAPTPGTQVGLPSLSSLAETAAPTTVTTDQLFAVTAAANQRWWGAAPLADGTVLLLGGLGADELPESGTAAIFDPRSGAIHVTGSLITPRVEASVTTLQDGRVLVTGGLGHDRVLASAEIYDPSTGTFSPATPMRAAGAIHSATLLADGRVLVVGLDDPRSEIYDPRTDRWALGPTTVARGFQSATRLQDGRVLVVGGWGGPQRVSAASELFDPSTNNFVRSGSLLLRRNQHTAVLLHDGRVLIVGGMTNPDGFTLDTEVAEAEMYDPTSGAFQAADGFGRRILGGNDAATIADGRVVVFGHTAPDLPAMVLFDPKRSSSTLGPRPEGLSIAAVDAGNGWVLNVSHAGIELFVPAGTPRPTWAAPS